MVAHHREQSAGKAQKRLTKMQADQAEPRQDRVQGTIFDQWAAKPSQRNQERGECFREVDVLRCLADIADMTAETYETRFGAVCKGLEDNEERQDREAGALLHKVTAAEINIKVLQDNINKLEKDMKEAQANMETVLNTNITNKKLAKIESRIAELEEAQTNDSETLLWKVHHSGKTLKEFEDKMRKLGKRRGLRASSNSPKQ